MFQKRRNVWGVYSRTIYTGRLCSFTHKYTILTQKLSLLLYKRYPFCIPFELKKLPLLRSYFKTLHLFSKPLE